MFEPHARCALIRYLSFFGLVLTVTLGLPVARAAVPDEALISQVLKELNLRESDQAARDMKGWAKPKKVVVVATSPEQLEWYQQVAPGVQLVGVNRPEDIPAAAKDADAILGVCDEAIVNASQKLKWLQVSTAGVEECQKIPRLLKGNILLSNGQRIYGPSIAEHVVGMMFYLARNFRAYTVMDQNEDWNRMYVSPSKFVELQGKTMLIVGLGGIGTSIAEKAHALGMRIIATRNSSREGPEWVDYVGLADEAIVLAQRADVVVNAAPLTPETQRMFNADFFAKMRTSAYFINIARGSQVVQADLISALDQKKIAGAALDVTDPEPLPKGDPLWKAPNLLITPHMSSLSDMVYTRMMIVMRENLRRYVAGEKIFSVVDLKRGY